jgi:hypothetical protein
VDAWQSRIDSGDTLTWAPSATTLAASLKFVDQRDDLDGGMQAEAVHVGLGAEIGTRGWPHQRQVQVLAISTVSAVN